MPSFVMYDFDPVYIIRILKFAVCQPALDHLILV